MHPAGKCSDRARTGKPIYGCPSFLFLAAHHVLLQQPRLQCSGPVRKGLYLDLTTYSRFVKVLQTSLKNHTTHVVKVPPCKPTTMRTSKGCRL